MRSFVILALLGAAPCLAQTSGEDVRIVMDFKPQRAQLEHVRGERLTDLYSGTTFRGLYFNRRMGGDQRFVETTSENGRTRYVEGADPARMGDWSQKGNTFCFRYDDTLYQTSCYHEYLYGDCLFSYSVGTTRLNLAGKPLRPELWDAVSKSTTEDFTWPDVPPSEVEAFTCRLLTS